MNETMRDRLKRRVWWCLAVAIVGWVVVIVSAAAGKGAFGSGLMVIGLMMFGGGGLALNRMKCPKCSGTVG